MPTALKDIRLQDGEALFCQSGPLTACKWRDHTRDVYMLSTKHSDSMEATGKRTREGDPIIKPSVVINYNKNKAGVDTSDQLASYHPFERRTIKWYKKLFFRYAHANVFLHIHKTTMLLF